MAIWIVTKKGKKWLDEVTFPVPTYYPELYGKVRYVPPDEETMGIVDVLETVDGLIVEGDTIEEAYRNTVELVESQEELEGWDVPDLKYWKEAYKRGFIEKVGGKVI